MTHDWLQYQMLGNTVAAYGWFLGKLALALLLIHLARRVIIARIRVMTRETETTLDDFLIAEVEKNLLPVLYFGAFSIAVKALALPAMATKTVSVLWSALVIYVIAAFVSSVLQYAFSVRVSTAKNGDGRARNFKMLAGMVRIIILGIGCVVLLDNLGVKISALVAGLGIGGVAVAFASQAILADLFSFFVILFDRPFEIDDFIVVGEYKGAIEHIGIKTTRIRSLDGEQVIFSNNFLTNAQVRNYKRMEKRRAVFKLGVTYETSAAVLRQIPGLVETIIRAVPETAFDRAHFSTYQDSYLEFEVVYFVLSADYLRYMDIQQEINLRVKEVFEQNGIVFAYPTQTLYIQKSAGAPV